MKFRGKEMIVWSLNNYLGLANHPDVRKADAAAAAQRPFDLVLCDYNLGGGTNGQQLLEHVPLAAFIRHSLEQEADGELKEEPFLKMLNAHMDPAEAERVLRVAIEWARYGEVFEYDFHTGVIHLPEAGED